MQNLMYSYLIVKKNNADEDCKMKTVKKNLVVRDRTFLAVLQIGYPCVPEPPLGNIKPKFQK